MANAALGLPTPAGADSWPLTCFVVFIRPLSPSRPVLWLRRFLRGWG